MSVENVRQLSRARVASCILINLSATPGLGSLMARRIFAGTCQLLLALAGFTLLMGWMLKFFYGIFLQQLDKPVPQNPPGWIWKWGLFFFGASWLWSLVTSLSLWRTTKIEEAANQKRVPPRLAEPPDVTSKKP